jgi:NAD(P)-dependent dehydrogenase (short-subunit alcohol dehydrogenase family)
MDNGQPGSVVIVGVGPGTGGAVARRFAEAGYAPAMVARKRDFIGPLAEEIIAGGGKGRAETTDITDEAAVIDLFARTEAELRPVQVAVFNASDRLLMAFTDIEMDRFQQTLDVNFKGAFLMAREAARRMGPRGHGSIFFTGAQSTFRGRKHLAAFGMAKAGTRGLALSMAEDLGPQGVHVANFNIDGSVDNAKTRARDPKLIGTGKLIDTTVIAETYYRTHCQARGEWDFDVHIRADGSEA